MLGGRLFCSPVILAGAILLSCQSTRAGLQLVSQSIQVDKPYRQVDFSLTFNHAPDFQTVDSFGRPADSFQYEIVPNTSAPFDQLSFLSIAAVIRGDEIGGGMLPIRNGVQNGSDPSPLSGGWGTIRASVPFTLNGNQLSFDASFNMLGTANGLFSYEVCTTNFGATVSEAQGVSVPLPPALSAGLYLLAAMGAVTSFRFGASRKFA